MSEFTEQVSTLVNEMVQGENGTWELPEDKAKDLDEPTLFAVKAEKRYRDTQGAYTRAQQEAKKQQAIAGELEEHILKNTEATLTHEQKVELTTLKGTDPDAWRAKLNEYETASKTTVADNLTAIRQAGESKGELAVREEMMTAFSTQTGIELTTEIVDTQLPPAYKGQLERGEITFEQFLTQASDFLTKNKVIAGAPDDDSAEMKSLADVAGGQTPSEDANNKDFTGTYEETIF